MAEPKKDPGALVIPFGKHKGATVVELLAKDPAYAEWATSQGWLAERFAEIHAALLARGVQIDDTPEHNAMQARFLDQIYCAAFLQALYGSKHLEQLLDNRKKLAICNFLERDTHLNNLWRNRNYAGISYDEYFDAAEDRKKELKQNTGSYGKHHLEEFEKIELEAISVCMQPLCIITSVAFEQRGVDVVLYWGDNEPLHIELKPTLGDDYPGVLRDMQRLGATIIVIGHFTGRGISENQMVAMFQANGFRVVFSRDIEVELLQVSRWIET